MRTLNGKEMRQDKSYFDGIICFGGQDWWYHNRGHNDIQLMNQFSRLVPILYVNSIGMRMPSVKEGSMFFTRIIRKLKSISRGLKIIRPNFGVYSPLSIPGIHKISLAKWFLSIQVKLKARRMGIHNPLIWMNCPPAAEVVDYIKCAGIIYMRFDRYEAYPWVNYSQIKNYDKLLKSKADFTIFTSRELFEEGKNDCRRAVLIDQGVDYDLFSMAGVKPCDPQDIKDVPHPRIGFIGGLDVHNFNPELFNAVASQLSDCNFILVGSCSLPEGWCKLPNIYLLGKRNYEDVPFYMAACDVLIMPWTDNKWVQATNPIKIKEYLAVGRPIVVTPIPELSKYEGLISIANNADEFTKAIREALIHPIDATIERERVKHETWKAKSEEVLKELEKSNIFIDTKTC